MIFIATYKRKLKDRSGNYVVPATKASCVYFDDNTTLSKLTFYPVGSIYQSALDTSPASLFGGTWEKIQGRFLLGTSSSHTLRSIGGEEDHTLSVSEIPSHAHGIPDRKYRALFWDAPSITDKFYMDPDVISYDNLWSNQYTFYFKWINSGTDYAGNSGAHNNMPPFYAVNIWKRNA